MKALNIILILGFIAILNGCAGQNPYGDSTENFSETEANKSLQVTYATIIDLQPVTIDSEGNLLGKATGAIIGGIAGSGIGGGRGSAIAAVAGAVIGGIAGNKIEEKVNKANGVQITVEFPNERVRAIIQEVNENVHFRRGDHVRIIHTASGKVRVMQ